MSPLKVLWVRVGLPAILFTGVLFYAVAVEPYAVERHDVLVAIQGLPKAFEGYRILHLSDFETAAPGRREELVVDIARQAHPDAIVVTGDLVRKSLSGEARLDAYRRMAAYLGALSAHDGVFFVQGHGEMASRINQDGLERILTEAGVKVLWDDVAIIPRPGGSLALAGIKVHDYGGEGRWDIQPTGRIHQGPGDRPAYLELAPPGAESWTDYELSGRLRFSSPDDWIGILVRSRLGVGQDRYYMALRRDRLSCLTASAHGAYYNHGEYSATRELGPASWHRFRVRVESSGRGVRMLGRTWDDGTQEPVAWDLTYADESASPIATGRPGIYAEGPGSKDFDDLVLTRPGEQPINGPWREPAGADFLLDLLSRVPAGVPMVLLSHTPDIFPDARALGIPLVLAGHTQGGQVRIPFYGAVITDTRLGREYASGLFVEGQSTLFVTRGIGTTRVPVRFLCSPEAALITLTAGPAS